MTGKGKSKLENVSDDECNLIIVFINNKNTILEYENTNDVFVMEKSCIEKTAGTFYLSSKKVAETRREVIRSNLNRSNTAQNSSKI